ncbi:MAG: excinuclease ABC subunit UvrA [Acidobacteriota bacterium]
MELIRIKGAREHNLKNLDVTLPKNKLVVITGLSGSGKSSLAFDTLYAEGQRRYVESLSAYARQFLDLMEKPDVDSIEGLSPAISIEQRSTSHNPRSTVGTVTEIYDYLRVLFARVGKPFCPQCGRPIESQTVQQMVDQILSLPEGERIYVLAPVVRGRKGEYRKLLAGLLKEGFVRARVDGKVLDLQEDLDLARYRAHTIEILVDRLVVKPGVQSRLTESVELALQKGEGLVVVHRLSDESDLLFSERLSCPTCGTSLPELEPRLFSFNSPHGACTECSGLGVKMELDPAKIVPNPNLSLAQGAVVPWPVEGGFWYREMIEGVGRDMGFSLKSPWCKLPEEARQVILYGSNGRKIAYDVQRDRNRYQFEHAFEGVIPNLMRRYRETKSDASREEIEAYMSTSPCPACGGRRLKPEALSVKVGGHTIAALTDLSVREARRALSELELSPRDQEIARMVLKEIRSRLSFLDNVGLGYLTLSRTATTLSGGESQRIRLATQVGSQLTGVLYVLDEPSIGLHQRDNRRLLDTLMAMRDLGNTVVVVEHDEETIRTADHVVDLGPGAGVHGGEVVAEGGIEDLCRAPRSVTGAYISGRRSIPVPAKRRKPSGWLKVLGASEHNLKGLDVAIPLGVFTVVAGVSGSGKSTLVHDILYKGLMQRIYHSIDVPGIHRSIEGWERVDKVIEIDQSPIGRTPRSNPATYTGLFTPIRDLFAQVPEARARGYKPGRFSFNVKGGRCEACQGDGVLKIEMHFLPDVYVTCDTCKGMRYNRETLEVRYKGKSIAEVLDMTVSEALEFFDKIPLVRKKLQTLADVGLGYLHLGQQATTLSGGEAQRIKLARELSRRATGNTLYVLDEPTTGLHFEDVRHLLNVLQRLVEAGNTVVVIEHNLDVIKSADAVLELGPEGGEEGGRLVACGTPEEVAKVPSSPTGEFLKRILCEGSDEKLARAIPD